MSNEYIIFELEGKDDSVFVVPEYGPVKVLSFYIEYYFSILP